MHSINFTPDLATPGPEDIIRAQARLLGFDAFGICAPGAIGEAESANLQQFLALGHHATMEWMARPERASLAGMWPEARSVIVVGHNYAPPENPLERLSHKQIGNISAYAQNADYHDVIKKRLKNLARWLVENHGGDVKVFVDTAPVMEKPLAQAAGIGWQGKHTCIVSREYGSWLFLGVLATTLTLPRNTAEADHCGSCTKCLDICPTDAFTGERQIDARRCISYLTIEHKGPIPLEFRKAIGNRIYGCDDCLAVCPWNKFAKISQEISYHPRETLKSPLLKKLVGLDDAGFRALFAKSPVKRIGRERFIRNVLIAIGNSGDIALIPAVMPLYADDSEILRDAARWALEELRKDLI